MVAFVLLLWLDIIMVSGWFILDDAFFKYMLAMFGFFTVPCAVDAFILQSKFPTLKALEQAFILITLIAEVIIVKIFRQTFVQFIKARTEVF